MGIFGGRKTIKDTQFQPVYNTEDENRYELFKTTIINNPSDPSILADSTMVDALMAVKQYFRTTHKKNIKKSNIERDAVNPLRSIHKTMPKGAVLKKIYTPDNSFATVEDVAKFDRNEKGNRVDGGGNIRNIDQIFINGNLVPNDTEVSTIYGNATMTYTLVGDATVYTVANFAELTGYKYEYTKKGKTYTEFAQRDRRDVFAREGDELTFLFDRIKQDGDTEPTKEYRRIFAKYGTNKASFEDIYDNEDLKDMYYVMADADVYGDFLKRELYRVGFNIVIDLQNGDTATIESGVDLDALYGDSVISMSKALYNGREVEEADSDGNRVPVIYIPIEFFNTSPLKEQYAIIRESLGFMSYLTKTVRVRWYQTMFFKFIVTAALIATGQIEGLAAMYGQEISSKVLGENSILTRAIQLYGLYNLATAATAPGATMASQIQFASSLMNMYVGYRASEYRDDIRSIESEKKEYLDQIKEAKDQFMYEPLDEWNGVRSIQYNMLYNSFGVLDHTYDYKYKYLRGVG
jgi:hypothetical protein